MLIRVLLKDHPLDVVKHAAFTLTGRAFVRLTRSQQVVRVELEAKQPGGQAGAGLEAEFAAALAAEAIRSAIAVRDKGLREHIIRLALRGESPPAEDAKVGLTGAQQKELDRLIAEVEAEIAKESSGTNADPLGVARTWEEAHGHAGTGKARKKK